MSSNLRELRARTAKNFDLRAKSDNSADLVIYGPIGASSMFDPDAIGAKQVSDSLKNLSPQVKEINVRLNSPGGCVFEGIAIYNRLKQHKARINVFVDGLAASIASIIMLAGDEITIGEGALCMVHNPYCMAIGNKSELDQVINRLLDVEQQMLGIYSRRTGLDRTELTAMLDAETWFDADQAVEMGFADKKMTDSLPIAASVFDKSPWINKAPKKFNSSSKMINSEIKSLREKIELRLARK